MPRPNHVLLSILLAGLFLLTACGPAVTTAPGATAAEPTPTATTEASPDPALQDTEWLLTSLRGEALVEGSRITLNVSEDKFGGLAGCNNYGGTLAAAGGGILRTSEIAVTAMACPSPEGVMEQETAYIQALVSAATYRLADGRLEMAGEGGETILVFARKEAFDTDAGALVGTAWRPVSADGESLGDGPPRTLVFYSESILGGRAGCEDYIATYQMSGDNLNLLFEAMLDAGCPAGGAYEQDMLILDVMAPKADLRLDDGRLEIHGERGGVVVLEPLPEGENRDLEGTTWSLLATIGPNRYAETPDPWPMPEGPMLGTTVELLFEAEAARGTAGCNDYGAAYARTGPSLSFETVVSTEMACLEPAGVMEQEGRYLELLAAVTGYRIYGERLWLETGDGRALLFYAAEQ